MAATANIYYNKSRGHHHVILNVDSIKMINTTQEICFDKDRFVMRIPTIFDNRTYKVSYIHNNSSGSFSLKLGVDYEGDVTGKYLIEKDGDDFLLIKK